MKLKAKRIKKWDDNFFYVQIPIEKLITLIFVQWQWYLNYNNIIHLFNIWILNKAATMQARKHSVPMCV